MTDIEVEHAHNSITVNGNKKEFDGDVIDVLVSDQIVLVLIETYDLPPDHPYRGRNVFALDRNGDLIWQIEESGGKIEDKTGKEVPESYMEIRKSAENHIRVFQISGYSYDVDSNTGRISNSDFSR